MKLSFHRLILPLAVLFGAGLILLLGMIFVPTSGDEKILDIHSGDTARQIAANLADKGIIHSRSLFLLLTKLRHADRNLQVGRYTFGGQASLWQTVTRLREGKSEAISITFPEGLSLYKTLSRIDRSSLMPLDSLQAAATDTALVRRLTGFQVRSLEGFLYPETYRFSVALDADSILAVQTAEFFKRLAAEGIYPAKIPDFYQKLILASIVEKEAGPASERATIAGVFVNRMRIGMRLQSCPTVDYIMEPQGIKREVLSYRDTQIDSPYNTYRYLGLPPTPIANPSVASIKAALNPARHNYLYFFSDRKGRNVFSRTYEEHLRKQHAR